MQEAIHNLMLSQPYKIVLSKPKNTDYRKVQILKKEKNYQIERYTKTQVFHENVDEVQLAAYLGQELGIHFYQMNAWDAGEKEHQFLISKKGKLHQTIVKKSGTVPKKNTTHNRKKQYLIPEGVAVAPLVDMGIFTQEGKVVSRMQDKYRQINRFVELVDDVAKSITKDRIRIIDFGCGKSYLTFILYYYFTEIRHISVDMIGLDLKEDVITKCNQAARKYGYNDLHFEHGDITTYQKTDEIDMVITLHACDTATDYALCHAIEWGADYIFSVPCCQHELNKQIKSDTFSALTRYGIVQERVAALMTDAIRGELLEAHGYKVDLLEFVDMSHTPKNILIRAKKRKGNYPKAEERIAEVERLMKEFSLQPTMYHELIE